MRHHAQRTRHEIKGVEKASPPLAVRLRKWIRVVDRPATEQVPQLQAQYSYSPYGGQTKIAGTGPDADFGYAGMYIHARSGLNLTMFRAYNPALGRWLSRDPLGEAAGTNMYAYVRGNPVTMVDPLGLFPGEDPTKINLNIKVTAASEGASEVPAVVSSGSLTETGSRVLPMSSRLFPLLKALSPYAPWFGAGLTALTALNQISVFNERKNNLYSQLTKDIQKASRSSQCPEDRERERERIVRKFNEDLMNLYRDYGAFSPVYFKYGSE